MDGLGFSGILDALRAEARKHLLVETEVGSELRDRDRLEAGDEFVIHVTVSAVWAGDDGAPPTPGSFRDVRLHVRGTDHTELLTWRDALDPPLLLAEDLAFGESVSTTVRLRATRGLTLSAPSPESLAEIRVEADADFQRFLRGLECRATSTRIPGPPAP